MNVLIVGLGSIAKKHISAILEIDAQAKIYALRSGKGSINEVESTISCLSLSEIDMQSIDFVIISNPTSEHFNSIRTLAKYNKPLFIEKPLFSEITEETQQLVAEIENQKIPTYIACNLRFLDAIKEIKTLIAHKRINEVNVYCGSFLPDWRPRTDFRTIYSANKEMGGGVHIDLIHELDYVYWLFGPPGATRSFFSSVSSLQISAIDYANYLWSYPDFQVSIVLNYYRKDSKRTMEIVTDSGTYLVNLLKNTIEFESKCIFASSQKILETYTEQMRFFIEKIVRDKKTFNTITDANTILGLCMQD